MKTFMVDMDNTLIHSLFEKDPDFKECQGHEIIYNDGDDVTKIKINIRPYAIDLVKKISESGHVYILWSAGVKDYVHAVMNYFIKVSGVIPSNIYTREDMISNKKAANDLKKSKSMSSKGYEMSNVIIIDDNPDLLHEKEKENNFQISTWTHDKKSDVELKWIIEIIKTYDESTDKYHYEKVCYNN